MRGRSKTITAESDKTKPPLRYYLLIFACIIGCIACGEPINHDAALAGKRAVEFAKIAFVRQDAEKAYALLSSNTKRYVPFEKFKETLSRLHPSGHPSKVSAIEYEPMPGEKAIYIYITGEDTSGPFDYTLTMEGTASTDYRVSKFTRGVSYLPSTTEKKRFSQPIT